MAATPFTRHAPVLVAAALLVSAAACGRFAASDEVKGDAGTASSDAGADSTPGANAGAVLRRQEPATAPTSDTLTFSRADASVGDLVLVTLSGSAATVPFAIPSDWTSLGSNAPECGGARGVTWAYHFVGANEPAQWSFRAPGNTDLVGLAVTYGGLRPDGFEGRISTTGALPPYETGSLTTTSDRVFLVASFVLTQSDQLDPPPGMVPDATNAGLHVFSGVQTVAGPSGKKTAPGTGNECWTSMLAAFRIR